MYPQTGYRIQDLWLTSQVPYRLRAPGVGLGVCVCVCACMRGRIHKHNIYIYRLHLDCSWRLYKICVWFVGSWECREGGRGSGLKQVALSWLNLKIRESGFSCIFAASTEALAYYYTNFTLAFIVCECADQSIQQQIQVIICILKHMHRHFNVCRTGSKYSSYYLFYSM